MGLIISLGLTVGLLMLTMLAQWNVQSTFAKFARVPIRKRLTGAQAARYILDSNGLQHVNIEHIRGELNDHYDPQQKVLRLSDAVYGDTSLAAVGVAAHEAGHAIQDRQDYMPLKFRQGIFPLAAFGSNVGMWMIVGGVLLAAVLGPLGGIIALLGFLLYATAVLFSLVTLPVEYDASNRAMVQLQSTGIIDAQEAVGTQKVLNAAAWTYVAATIASIATLLYYAWILFGSSQE